MISKYLMITFKLFGQQEQSVAQRSSISLECSLENCKTRKAFHFEIQITYL